MTRIVETANGYEFTLDGQRYGTWRSKAEAAGGLSVELRRKKQRETEESVREIEALDASVRAFHEWRLRD
jgi:hypothetical protein